MLQNIFVWIQARERHLSALAMVAGFIADGFFFERVDLWQTHAVFASYTAICFFSILILHGIETRILRGTERPRWSSLLPIATQFALGGFWSGFIVFYGRSAVLGVSWPFLVFLALVFLGNEYFRDYHTRLVFTSTLFFFAIYSYVIFALPVYTGSIGTVVFLESGAVAIGVFILFTVLLRLVGRERFLSDVWRIRVGAFCVLIVINIFYFTNILPPLPLSMKSSGVYHSVWRIPGDYMARDEPQSWQTRYLGLQPVLHIIPDDPLYAYGSVFAPTSLKTIITHHWQWYDPARKEWVTKAKIVYPIIGGRDGGYRGFTYMPMINEGKWRVNIETSDGRTIARLPFIAEYSNATDQIATETIDLN
jgi:hypothetical protein